mgnify:CR=1 FL=1
MAELRIKRDESFSYGFDPGFQQRYVEFWKSFIDDVPSGLRKLKDDPVLFIEMCCKTASKDPVTGLLSTKQLELFETQKDTVRDFHSCFIKREPLIVLKSRQQGASWLISGFAVWIAIFIPNQVILYTTRDEDSLHTKGDPTTLMGKPEYIIEKLPKILKKHAIHKWKCYNFNFQLNDTIMKGQTGKEAARSTTASLSINDEFAFNKYQKQLKSSLINACPCNIFISTLNTPGDEFDQMRKSKAYQKTVLDWRDDPRIKDKDLFREQYIARNGYADFLREIDMKFNTADALYLFEPEWVEKLPVLYKEPIPNSYPIIAGMDVAAMGNNNNVVIVRQGPHILRMYSWNKCHAHESFEVVNSLWEEYQWSTLVFDEVGVGSAMASEFDRRRNSIMFHVVGVNVGSPARDNEDDTYDDLTYNPANKVYTNLRARLYWTLRERVRKSVLEIASPDDQLYIMEQEILDEMGPMTYDTINQGKIRIVSKRDLKENSPDSLDALMLTMYAEEVAHVNDAREYLYGR